jgi:hypothetical protein
MNLIVPIAGRSARFPAMKPKWMLTHPRGNMMIVEAIKGLDLAEVDKIYIVGLAEHEEEFGFTRFLSKQLETLRLEDRLQFIVLPEQTRNQPETIAQAIEQAGIVGPIYIKDSDNYFCDKITPGNRVACFDLHDLEHVNARNKSYIEVDSGGHLRNIVEKRIVSSTFCVGGYSFESAEEYMKAFNRLEENDLLYVSHIIYSMILEGAIFTQDYVSDYVDWGTLREWNDYKRQYSTLFIDLDGTLVINSGQYSQPGWGETDGIKTNIDAVNALYDTGKVEVIITTSRTEAIREATFAQMERIGIRYHQIIFGLVHGRRIVINDYANTNPFKSCDAINIRRDSDDLREMLEESVGFNIDVPAKKSGEKTPGN